MATVELLQKNYAGAVKALAGASMAFVASGAMKGLANSMKSVSDSTEKATESLEQLKEELKEIKNITSIGDVARSLGELSAMIESRKEIAEAYEKDQFRGLCKDRKQKCPCFSLYERGEGQFGRSYK